MNIVITGDYCPQERVQALIDNNKGITVFQGLSNVLKDADYSITNFECSVVDDKNVIGITKFGPCLSTNTKGVKLLKEIGFSCVTLANNHFRDYGNKGVENSIRAFNENGLDFCGGGLNIIEAQRIFYKEINGKMLAIVNICENEFSIATMKDAGSAPLDLIDNYNQISEAKRNADFVLVIIHGGSEGWQYPTPRMKKTYQWFIDIGADAVVNHHQHCYSGYEIYEGKPIFYGLGNFCFDEDGSRDSIWNYGYLVRLCFDDIISFDLFPYEQCNHEATVKLLTNEKLEQFNQNIKEINNIINSERALQDNYQELVNQKSGYLAIVSPYLNEHVRALASRHWIPYFLPRKKLLNILNFVECESHRDAFISVMRKHIYND
ncbi:CapA family protein [uncultured Prevotella sp.]|uniref:CapA family protein n=1 Tax=uncultured Prevotella sp. TaxID=159272 RepID=UPI0025883D12|nr:CapA family protein [uncultured Prevotella sp.]